MILPNQIARGVAEGTVCLVFRRWTKPNVRAGDTLRTVAGVIAVDSIESIAESAITEEQARQAGAASAAEVRAALRGPAGAPLYCIAVRWAGPDPRVALSQTSELAEDELAEIQRRLDRLDSRSERGPWTHDVLEVIAAHPGTRAAELAELLGRERDALKLDVRKLKNLGLTHSLDVGYRLAPRGAAYLANRRHRDQSS
ncbi:hypothetical protein EV191_101859 [Tamaricihabitans halophyticus]|uniref:ASCH domain-containing protein n=1 Tax=Tamaricihabitans halophyticus TaxID=1262583 RepID=A0A4R2R2E5_9PSEU|nr:hypothetical protein [Tamaricihabitans halophyticus]TCP56910.1 hypothetical protein EV191_101859 [Tamaricihabitans halophyticus]